MVLQTETTSLLDDSDPPFLQEPTVLVTQEPLTPALDRLVDIVYHWRLILAVGLVPLFLAAMALSFNSNTASEPDSEAGGPDIAAGEAISALESMARGVVPADPRGATDNGSDNAGSVPASEPSIPALPSPPTTDPNSTTTEPTVVSTTAPPTTAPPTTIVQCLLSVERRVNLRAAPDKDSERLDRVDKGTYGGFGSTEDGSWYQIDYQGTIGWIRERSVDVVQGAC